MKKNFIFLLVIASLFSSAYANSDTISSYTKKSYMIPMRDGIRLFTVVITPVQNIKPCPILMQRTPYGSDIPIPDDSQIPVGLMGTFTPMAREGYIFVLQDVRGKFKSEEIGRAHV
jgi:uncharacterized protein